MLLDGKRVREGIRQDLKNEILEIGIEPTLVIIQIGDKEESNAYIAQKKQFGLSIGAKVLHEKFPENVSEEEVISCIEMYNIQDNIQGIIVQLPLPASFNIQKVIDTIDPSKDVDGLTSVNVRRLAKGDTSGFIPATAAGIFTLLEDYKIEVSGKKVVVVGRSALVGKPVAELARAKGAHVVVCHSKTVDVPKETKQADILIVAIGVPEFFNKNFVSKGQTVVDVGINLRTGIHFDEEIPGKKYVGDVDFDEVVNIVSDISPVPGGVGPMTVASLFENLVQSLRKNVS